MAYTGRIDLNKMIELYNEGMSTEEMAKSYGYKNDGYIISRLKQAGVYKNKAIDKGKVYALHKAGWSNAAIAFELVTTEKEIEEILKYE